MVCPRSHPASPILAAFQAASPWLAVLSRGDDPPDPPRGTLAVGGARRWPGSVVAVVGWVGFAGWPWLGGRARGGCFTARVCSVPVVHLICLTRVDSGSEGHQWRLPRSSEGAAERSRGVSRRDVRPGASGGSAAFEGGSPGETSGSRQVRNPAPKSQIVRTSISMQGRPARGGVARAEGNP